MRKGEFESFGAELLDVLTSEVGGLLDLDDFENLKRKSTGQIAYSIQFEHTSHGERELTWIDLNLARCLAAKSWYRDSTAAVLDMSLYSLYMLCVPLRESYRIQMPKFLTFRGRFSWIYIGAQWKYRQLSARHMKSSMAPEFNPAIYGILC